MITEYMKQQLAQKVTNELANIYKFYGKDFFALDRQERLMIVEIFQSGIGFMDKLKKEEIDKGIKDLVNDNRPIDEIPF